MMRRVSSRSSTRYSRATIRTMVSGAAPGGMSAGAWNPSSASPRCVDFVASMIRPASAVGS